MGESCNHMERAKGLEISQNLKNEDKKGKAHIYFPKEDAEADEEFWKHLGGKPDKINPPVPDDIEVYNSNDSKFYELYHISNETGKLLCT